MSLIDRDMVVEDVLDRIESLEHGLREIQEYALSPQAAGTVPEQPNWAEISGWVITGDTFRDVNGYIVLDAGEPMIQVSTGGYIQSSDFVSGTSGFQINGGAAEFNDIVARGTVYATAGEVGGWSIGANTITADSGAVGLNSEATGGTDWRIWAGNATPGSAPFRVDESGNLYATSGEIGGWTITSSELHNSNIWLDANALQLAIGSKTWQARGIQLEYNAGTPRAYIGDGSSRYFEYDGTDVEIGGSLIVHGSIEASVFNYQAITATSGSLVVASAASQLKANVTSSSSKSFDVDVKDPLYGHVQLFSIGDILYVKNLDGVSNWWSVDSVIDQTTYYTYQCTLESGAEETFYAATPIIDYGQSGDGALKLTADETNAPYYSVTTHAGAPWSANTEVARLGNLNGNWGYSSDTYGLGLGEYASNKANLTWDPTNGLRLRTYSTTVIQLDNSGNANITNKLRMPGSSSAIAIGATPPTGSSSGTGIWIDRTGFYSLDAGTYEVKIDATNGKFYGGGGDVVIDASGITLAPGSSNANSIKWNSDSAWIWTVITGAGSDVCDLVVQAPYDPEGFYTKGTVKLQAYNGVNYDPYLEVDGVNNIVDISTDYLKVTASTNGDADVRIDGGLYVGDTATDPDAGEIWLEDSDGVVHYLEPDPAGGDGIVLRTSSNRNEIFQVQSSGGSVRFSVFHLSHCYVGNDLRVVEGLAVGGDVDPPDKTLHLVNRTSGPGTPSGGARLYAYSGELVGVDSSGNSTTLTPHRFDLIPGGASEPMAWSYYGERDGCAINVDMLHLARLVEGLTGEQLVYIQEMT